MLSLTVSFCHKELYWYSRGSSPNPVLISFAISYRSIFAFQHLTLGKKPKRLGVSLGHAEIQLIVFVSVFVLTKIIYNLLFRKLRLLKGFIRIISTALLEYIRMVLLRTIVMGLSGNKSSG